VTDNPTCADLLDFIHGSPTPYHAVESAAARLKGAGFLPLSEAAPWRELAPGRYYTVRGDGTLLAFVLPERPTAGFRIIGAHTDSPNLRLKPRAEYTKEGYVQLGVEVYGGALLNSWLDRDLSLAGRVIARAGDGQPVCHLLRIDRPLLRIPQLAIHLDREVNERGLTLNKQEHLAPVLSLAAASEPKQGPDRLTELCAQELSLPPAAIVTLDLMLYDVVPPVVAGLNGELVFSPRLDNQAMCHAAVCALLRASQAPPPDVCPLIVLFDHEEVGSGSAQGAGAPVLPTALERILLAQGLGRDDYHRAVAASVCVSADMAHAVHPNYADRHEARHKPVLNGGPVIKHNSQQRYATCARTAALFQALCEQEDVPVQHYVHRTDLPCGSTIGPITATLLGIRTVDVGSPMLSMHSARELCGSRDPELMTRVLTRFLSRPEPLAT
jgi:aspartyl aminopeptidase